VSARPVPIALRPIAASGGHAPRTVDLSDEAAIARMRQGDSGSLYLLFDRYSRLVLHTALPIVRDFGEAEEVVQETFFLPPPEG
jgi:hypothetical protein